VRLSDVIGQDQATQALRRAVAAGRVPHAYLFEGPPGVGKRAAALGLAQALECPVAPGAGCGACDTCRRIEAGIHPDAPILAPTSASSQILIDEVKQVVALAQSRPHEAPARLIVIDEADAMNANAANALLKTLEEPAPRNHLVLCSASPERLPTTIRSRTQRVRFRALPAEALLAIAETRGIARERAEVAVALADGSAARMLEAVAADDGAAWQAVADLRAAVTAPAMGPVFDAAQALGSGGGDREGRKEGRQELGRLIGLLGRLYRDALVTAAGAPELALFAARAGELAAAGTERLGRALTAIVEADTALVSNVNPTLVVERLLLELKRREGHAA
jgi:DNA polymerase-3 subunit delta'